MRRNYYNKPISKTFIQAFPKFKNIDNDTDRFGNILKYFWESWLESPFFTDELDEQDLLKCYNHLLAKYYNWNFIYIEDIGILLNVFHVIEEYYPNVKERLTLARQLRDMTIEEFKNSGMQVTSGASNPKIKHDMSELVGFADNQTASFQKKSTEQTIKAKFYALYDGIMDVFIDKFSNMFVQIYSGMKDYIYINIDDKEIDS